jgi:nucleotide-binding universal stress UspA family protein
VNPSQLLPTILVVVALLILAFVSRRRKSRAPAVAVPQAAASARQSMHTVRKIMVPTTGTDYSERAVELACRMGEDQQATIYLLHVMAVPRSQPLGTPQPQEETKAKDALSRAESIVRSHGLTCETRVERARTAGEGIIKRAKEIGADVIIVGMRPTYDPNAANQDRTSAALLRDAPCEVIFDKMPNPAPSEE